MADRPGQGAGGGVKRTKRLQADPVKVRAWQDRSRTSLRRTPGFTTSNPQRGGFRATNPQFRRGRVPGLRGFTQRVFTLYGRRCVVCRGRAVQAHHCVPLRTLFARSEAEGQALGADARNGVPVCAVCHERHENASRRIRRGELPAGVVEWALANGFGWYLDRTYPGARA